MNRIITIGREFGSGGREFGRRLSEKLGFAYYDQEIISEISKRTSLSEQYVQAIVEHRPSFSFPIHIITEMADRSDCVIVGRCADHILKEHRPFRIFIYADMESKIKRCREKGSEEKLSNKELRQKISRIDKKRAKYYEFYTGHSWGDKLNFDLCINTTQTAIKEIVPVIAKLF